MGYLLKWTDGGAKIELEADTVSCSHCQRVMTVQHWKQEGPWCYCCAHAICLPCLAINRKTGCVPFMKQVDLALRRQKLLQEV